MITEHGQKMFDAEIDKLRRESVDAILIGFDGTRTPGIVDVAFIPDGENAGEPVIIDPRTLVRPAAVEFGGRRFEWCATGTQAHWAESW